MFTCQLSAFELLLNTGFEAGLPPWKEGRSFGSYRSWDTSTVTSSIEGNSHAFCLGRIELKQDIKPVPANEIQKLSFQAAQQFTNRGNFWVEVFYTNQTSSGFIEFGLRDGLKGLINSWELIDLKPHLDNDKIVSAISIVGIPNNVLSIDDFVIEVSNEKLAISATTNSIRLNWFGRLGKSYTFWQSDDLNQWNKIGDPITGQSKIIEFQRLTETPRMFFKIESQ